MRGCMRMHIRARVVYRRQEIAGAFLTVGKPSASEMLRGHLSHVLRQATDIFGELSREKIKSTHEDIGRKVKKNRQDPFVNV